MIPDRISPVRFAAAIAARLDSVVPTGLSVRAKGAWISLYDPASWGYSTAAQFLANEDRRPMVKLIESVADSIMSAIQDEVMESTREQWPLRSGSALPHAKVIGAQLHLWFGDETAPILRLEPLNLSEVAEDARTV